MTEELIVAVSGLSRLKTMERKSTSDRISDELRQMIIEGSLLPGEQLGEARIAEQLGVSRAPVREALQQLVQQKLLVASRNKGVTVVTFSASDIWERWIRAFWTRCASSMVGRVRGRGPRTRFGRRTTVCASPSSAGITEGSPQRTWTST